MRTTVMSRDPTRGYPGVGRWCHRTRWLPRLAVVVALFTSQPAFAQKLEHFAELIACVPKILGLPAVMPPQFIALLEAMRNGDLLDIAEVMLEQVYPFMAERCADEITDQLHEFGVGLMMRSGASKRTSDEARHFLADLSRRGLAGSPRAGRLYYWLSREAELSGRIPDAFAAVDKSLSILRRPDSDDVYRGEAELQLKCLREAVAIGASSCAVSEDIAGPFGLFPPSAICEHVDPLNAEVNWLIAKIFGQPLEVAFFKFCEAERHMREEIETAKRAPPAEATDRVVDAMLDIARSTDRLLRRNAVARAQARDLAATYAFGTALAQRRAGNAALADHLLRRAHEIADASAAIRRSATEQIPAGYKGWLLPIEPWGAHLVALMLESNISPARREAEAFAVLAAAKFDGTSERLRAALAVAEPATDPLGGFDAAKAVLRPGEAMLAIRLTPAGIGAGLLIRPNGSELYPIMLTQAEASVLVGAYREQLKNGQAAEFDPTAGAKLYASLFGPLDAKHALDGVSALFLVPDRTIESVPAAALITGVTGETMPAGSKQMARVPLDAIDTIHFLRDRFSVTMLPTMEDLAVLRGAKPLRWVIPYAGLANPVGPAIGMTARGHDWPLAALPETAGQVEAARKNFSGQPETVLIGQDATLENLLNVLEKGPFDVVEFATHAASERPGEAPLDVPEAPWLLISPPGGSGTLRQSFLGLQAIRGLPLRANLVILSACDTANPAGSTGEGLLSGLARAFIQAGRPGSAGARSLIVTYWQADYAATTDIMKQVSTELAANRAVSLGKAVTDAQTQYATDRARPAIRRLPYYWAALAAVGPRAGPPGAGQ